MSSSIDKATYLATLLILFSHCVNSLIIPEELPTILSVIYSNIPPIKKGTDSRLGIGFRLGEHADFQILTEIGPQRETGAIGNDVDSKRKRAVMLGAAMRGEYGPWAQAVAKYQVEQKLKKMLEKYKLSTGKLLKSKDNLNETTDNKSQGSEWLSKWSQGLTVNNDESTKIELGQGPKILPNINRMRVVNHPISSDNASDNNSAKNDLNIFKKLYVNNNNETKSVE